MSYAGGTIDLRDRLEALDAFTQPRMERVEVEEASEVLPALRRLLERVRAGQSAVIDVILARP